MTDHLAVLEEMLSDWQAEVSAQRNLHYRERDHHFIGMRSHDIERLAAAIALMRGQSWQPIETAPKDGTSILATEIDGEPVVSYFDEGGWVYSWHAYDGYHHWNPTHWQPLPAPPKDTADEQ